MPYRLSDRYTFVKRLRGPAKSLIWVARDEEADRDVVMSVLPAARAAGLLPLLGWSHPHVAPVVAVIDQFDTSDLPGPLPAMDRPEVVVAGYISGRSIHQRLRAGPVDRARAVQWAERLAEALASMHAIGGVHGAISPRAVIVSRIVTGMAPIVTHLVVPPSGAYCSPERVLGQGPSTQDDVWALSATLYTTLAGTPPFTGTSRRELAHSILDAKPGPIPGVDTDLAEIVLRGLSPRPDDRLTDARALAIALRDWMHRQGVLVGDGSYSVVAPTGSSASSISPAPPSVDDAELESAARDPESEEAKLPVSSPPPPMTAPPIEAPPATSAAPIAEREPEASPETTRAKRQRTRTTEPRRAGPRLKAALATIAIGLAVAVAFGLSRSGPAPRAADRTHAVKPAPSSTPAPAGVASASLPSASAANEPSMAVSADAGTDNPTSCMRPYLAEGAFGESPDLAFVCETTDLWAIARKLFSTIAKDGRGEGVKLWVHLTPYELAAAAILRRDCCPSASSFTAAVPDTECGTLTDPLVAVATDPTPTAVERYEETIDCLIERQVRYPEPWDRVGRGTARSFFDRFLADARRVRETRAP